MPAFYFSEDFLLGAKVFIFPPGKRKLRRMDDIAVKKYPRVGQAILLTLLLLIATVLVSFLFVVILKIFGAPQIRVNNPVVKISGYTVPFVLVILYGWLRKNGGEAKAPVFQIRAEKPVVYPVLLILALSLTILTEPLTNLIPMPEFFVKIFEQALSHDFPTLLLIVIIAPVMEELFFRGIILDGLLENYSPQKSILWSSLLFGLAHLNPWQFIPALILGLLIGWVYWKTKSLLNCMFIHFSVNLSGTILFVTMNDATATMQQAVNNTFLYLLLLVFSLIVFILLFRWLDRYFGKELRAVDPR